MSETETADGKIKNRTAYKISVGKREGTHV
jgi:hypothetical protein